MAPEDLPSWPPAFYLMRAIPDSVTANAVAVALHHLNEYARFALIQVQRIRASVALTRERSHPDATQFPASPDVHFYFILWATVAGMVDYICQSTRFVEAGKLRRQYLEVLEHYAKGRDDFEHFEERMPGTPSKKARPIVIDSASKAAEHGLVVGGEMTGTFEFWRSGFVEGDAYHFGGLEWDVGPSSADQLARIAAEFGTAVVGEARRISEERDNLNTLGSR